MALARPPGTLRKFMIGVNLITFGRNLSDCAADAPHALVSYRKPNMSAPPSARNERFLIFHKKTHFFDSEEKCIGQSKTTPGRKRSDSAYSSFSAISRPPKMPKMTKMPNPAPARSLVLCEILSIKKCGNRKIMTDPRPRQIICFQ